MAWNRVISSMMDAYDYDAAMRVLHVRFVNGETYSYQDVPPDLVQGLANAESVGRYFHQFIKDRFAAL